MDEAVCWSVFDLCVVALLVWLGVPMTPLLAWLGVRMTPLLFWLGIRMTSLLVTKFLQTWEIYCLLTIFVHTITIL